ncbi:hypothetical protein Tco_1417777 [Tanacetum coccineum]
MEIQRSYKSFLQWKSNDHLQRKLDEDKGTSKAERITVTNDKERFSQEEIEPTKELSSSAFLRYIGVDGTLCNEHALEAFSVGSNKMESAAQDKVSTAQRTSKENILSIEVSAARVNQIFLQKDMDQESTHMVAASKIPMLKPENGNSPPKTHVVEGKVTPLPPATAEEKA